MVHGYGAEEVIDEGDLIKLRITNEESEKIIANLDSSLQEVGLHLAGA